MRYEMTPDREVRHHVPASSACPDHLFLPSAEELAEKHRRVGEFLRQHGLEGVLLATLGNFAWITGGRRNQVGATTEVGPAAILVTRDAQYLVTDEVEAPRLLQEELQGRDIGTLIYPWYQTDPAEAVRRRLPGRVAVDHTVPGLDALPPEFAELRWSLTQEEIARYRWLGEHAGLAMTLALFHLRPGLTEQQIAGMLAEMLISFGIQPTVLLVAADERMAQFRHPLSTERTVKQSAMLVVGARRWGLIASLTRLVHFGEPDAELRRRHLAVAGVDAAFMRATQPGAVAGEIFKAGMAAYAAHGYPDEWERLHQGGATGYAGREYRATPMTSHRVRNNQAFAWNPSIAGTKSEDTSLVTAAGIEVVTTTPDLPHIEVGGLVRPDILVR
jgi:Xaa-Pro aminopeptidase